MQKGLYDDWLALSKRGSSPRKVLKLVGATTPAAPDPEREQKIGQEYQAFFQCLSDAAGQKGEKTTPSFCEEAAGDRLAALVCETVAYVKDGRAASKEFVDALPTGKKGAEMIWDLETIAATGQKSPATIFLPKGPAYKVIDELFVLVLDDKEGAVSKFLNIAGSATDAGARYMDGQIKVFLHGVACRSRQGVGRRAPVAAQNQEIVGGDAPSRYPQAAPGDCRLLHQRQPGLPGDPEDFRPAGVASCLVVESRRMRRAIPTAA